jgi:hypothetical protein
MNSHEILFPRERLLRTLRGEFPGGIFFGWMKRHV